MSAPALTRGGPCMDPHDEMLAVRHHVPLLITAPSHDAMTSAARRVHIAAFGAPAPLVMYSAAAFSEDDDEFAAQWAWLTRMAEGGSMLLVGIDEMSRPVQTLLMSGIERLRDATPSRTPRLISGTTRRLRELVEAGRFSEHLFYRLNMIHLRVGAEGESRQGSR